MRSGEHFTKYDFVSVLNFCLRCFAEDLGGSGGNVESNVSSVSSLLHSSHLPYTISTSPRFFWKSRNEYGASSAKKTSNALSMIKLLATKVNGNSIEELPSTVVDMLQNLATEMKEIEDYNRELLEMISNQVSE